MVRSITHGRHLVGLAMMTLLAFMSVGALSGAWPVVTVVHVVLAVGVLPLMTAMIIHFSAVLARSRPAEGIVAWLPVLAMVTGVAAFLAMQVDRRFVYLAAALGGMIGGVLLAWMRALARRSVGAVHPGLLWYQGAVVFFLLAMASIVAGMLMPQQWHALRSLHMHCNLLGFLGITAIGTLQVLLPTVGGYVDEEVMQRLRVDFKYAVIGTLGAAIGAAWYRPLSWIGLVGWLIPVMHLAASVLRHRPQVWTSGGVLFSLFAALAGYLSLMLAGIPIVLGWMDPALTVPLFFMAFLFPLVTGALSHLLPLWLRQGDGSAGFHARDRLLLARGSRLRTLIFVGSGMAMAGGYAWSVYLALIGLVWFTGQVMAVVISESRATSRSLA
ncbi:MAG: hypothetical protein HQL66_07170 [Magnetococcales bacterium]|nr:hypothetical protein [Magnetococcales bacterium]